jgi:hypothetical protein
MKGPDLNSSKDWYVPAAKLYHPEAGRIPMEAAEALSVLTTASTEFGPAEYEELVGRVRSAVRSVLPVSCTVAVVSKGDDALLELDERKAWHFPRNSDGEYVGHHPYDSREAIGYLEELRAEGADYLLMPSTSFWWFSYYKDLAKHLLDHYQLRYQDERTCVIFSLSKGAAARSEPGHDVRSAQTHYNLLVDEIQDLAAAVLPPDAAVAVVSRGDAKLLELGVGRGIHFPPSSDGEYSAPWPPDSEQATLELEMTRGGGAEYFLIPETEYWCLDYYPGLRHHLESRHRLVLRQQHVCTIYELLSEPPQVAGPSNPDPQQRPPGFARFSWLWRKS